MVSTILAVCSALPSLLNLAGLIMQFFGANEVQLRQYQDMVNKQAEEGNISVDTHDRLLSHQAAIQARIDAAKKKAVT